MTLYQCSQEQRKMERDIRQAKRDVMTAREAGDETMLKEAKAKLATAQKRYKAFSEGCGLSRKPGNCRVEGYQK